LSWARSRRSSTSDTTTATAAGVALLPFILLMFFISRWSGTLFDRFGGRRPLIMGCSIAALGFALFAIPGVGGSYLTTFLLPILVLGLGVATSVPPLTTAVMSAVPSKHAGAASGVNNAVSRVAGLMAVAVFSIVMLRIFEPRLDEGLSHTSLGASAQAEIRSQSSRLGAAQLPKDLTASERASAERVIGSAFVAGFRAVALISAALALLAAVTAGRMIGERKSPRDAS